MTNYDLTGLTLPSSVHMMHTFPAEGDYEFRISPEGNRPRPSEPFQVAIWILADFFEYGCTTGVDACIADLKKLAKDTEDKDIRSTATGLAELIMVSGNGPAEYPARAGRTRFPVIDHLKSSFSEEGKQARAR